MIDHSTPTLLMPGGSRLRSLKPLRTRRGGCPLIYDVERNLLVEVPEEYRFHLGYALEKGEPDEELIGWLAANDLLTLDWGATEPPWDADHPGLSPDGPVAGLGRVFFREGRYHAQVDLDDETAARQTVGWLGRCTDPGASITLHMTAGPHLDLTHLSALVRDLERAAAAAPDAEVDFELTVDAASVDAEVSRFLAAHPFHVRTRCDGPLICEGVDLAWDPAHACEGPRAEGLTRLIRSLGDRLVVHSVLAGGVRLAYLWDWARESGVRRLHVTKVGRAYQPAGDPLARATELREFQLDLEAVAEEMFRTLEAGHSALLYEPMVRVVRRMAAQQGDALGTPTSLGVAADGHASPFLQAMWMQTVGVAEDRLAEEAARAEGGGSSPCNTCWGRRLCGRGKQPDPSLTVGERLSAGERRCDFWRAEIAAGLHFHQRLREIDPDYCLGLVGTRVGAFDGLDAFRQPVVWKTC